MKPLIITLLLAASAILAADEPKPDLLRMAERHTNALVTVEYELQFDGADTPEGGPGAERCPSCGQFHNTDLRIYLEEERPMEANGYLIAPDRVVTKDPQLHPRFVKSISVRLRDQTSRATILAYARNQRGILLSLEAPLPGGVPVQFDPAKGSPVASADLTWQRGRWCAMAMPYSESVIASPGEPAARYTENRGITLKADGAPLGIILDGWLDAAQAWQGSPLNWPLESADNVTRLLDQLHSRTSPSIPRVHLSFRSPKVQSEEATYRSRYSRSGTGEDLDEDTTEANVPGIFLAGGRLVVLANLNSKLTARLERIDVYTDSPTPVPAKFLATLKDVGVFIATVESAPGNLVTSGRDVADYRDSLLLRVDVELRGESRIDHLQTTRFTSFEYGPKRRLLPLVDGPTPASAFIFDMTGKLIAFAAQRRSPNAGDEGSYRSEGTDLMPATEIVKLLAALPGSSDLSNVPVSEAEENRLAWLGAELQPLDQELARANNVSTQTRDGETGALVTYVHPDSPAARAGVSVGSVLLRLKVAGRPLPLEVRLQDDSYRSQAFPWERLDEVPAQYYDRIPSPWSPVENSFIRALTDLGFGTKYTLEFVANGQAQMKQLEVESGPAHFDSAPRFKSESLGLTVRDLTYEVRRYLQRKADEPGVVVSKVEPGGRAGVAGVRPYELITHVNDQPVNKVSEFEALTAASGELKFSVRRMAKGRIVTIQAAN